MIGNIYSPISFVEAYTESATQKAPLGSRAQTPDGRKWVYCKAGTLTGGTTQTLIQPGNLLRNVCGTAYMNASNLWSTDTPNTTTLSMNFNHSSSCTTLAENELRDGYVYWTAWHTASATTGGGQMCVIAGNTAKSLATATDGVTITLRHPPAVNINPTTSSDTGKCIVTRNPFYGVKKALGEALVSQTGLIFGVAPITVTSEYYFWACTWGPMPVTTLATTYPGAAVWASTTTSTDGSDAWAGIPATSSDSGNVNLVLKNPKIGYAMGIGNGTSGEHTLVYLTLMP